MVHNESFLLYNLYNAFGAVKPHFFANNIIIFVMFFCESYILVGIAYKAKYKFSGHKLIIYYSNSPIRLILLFSDQVYSSPGKVTIGFFFVYKQLCEH